MAKTYPKSNTRHRRTEGRPSKPPMGRGKFSRPPRQVDSKPLTLEISPAVEVSLGQIGVPQISPFIPDPFQLEAVRLTDTNDVIVTAPTGSGKTWIAEEALARQLEQGGRSWYASPLKALSNSKFLEFGRRFGADNVGLLTGDHKVNIEAPIIIGTVEILRNQLYEAMSQGRDLDTNLVVLDEAHYLGDKDRGVVWEEVLIYLSERVRLLLLSATVANSAELAAWLSHNRGREAVVVSGGKRPVPLAGLCLWPSGKVEELAPRGKRSWSSPPAHPKGGGVVSQNMPNGKIMNVLKELNLLPAIFFLKSRADCDNSLSWLGDPFQESPQRYAGRQQMVDDYLKRYPFLADHPHLSKVRRQAAAAHHAGHLPHYKLMVEDLMSHGFLNAIFATSTVSAGVNFPARTVVIRQSDRFDGQGFSDFTSTELTQMTGRAGRRGCDQIGFAVAVPGPHQNLGLLANLINSPPDPVRSSLAINFSMVLNLLRAYSPKAIKGLLASSLAAWQTAAIEGQINPPEEQLARAAGELHASFIKHLYFLQKEGLVDLDYHLTPDGEWATELRLDHPLVFYAGVKTGSWPTEAAVLAAAVAGFTTDKESTKPLPRRKPPPRLVNPLTQLVMAVAPMLDRLEEKGFVAPSFHLRPAWAMWSWATRGDFDEAVELLGLGAGDMAMLALRCADHLRQMSGLSISGELPKAAREAIFKILKEPVSSPL